MVVIQRSSEDAPGSSALNNRRHRGAEHPAPRIPQTHVRDEGDAAGVTESLRRLRRPVTWKACYDASIPSAAPPLVWAATVW